MLKKIAENCPDMEHLLIYSPEVSSNWIFDIFQNFKQIQSVELRNRFFDTHSSDYFCDFDMLNLQDNVTFARKCEKLHTLKLVSMSDLTNETIQNIIEYTPNLTSLTLTNCHNMPIIDSAGQQRLNKMCEKLKVLNIDESLPVMEMYR